MPYRIWGVDAVSSGVFLLGPQADGVDRNPHYLAMISRQTLEEQLVHPDSGDQAMPIDIPPSLRGARPVVASLVRDRRRVVSGKSVSVRVDICGSRLLKKKK